MRMLILRSGATEQSISPEENYAQFFESAYAERVIRQISGARDACSACGPDCIGCRLPYKRQFADRIADVIVFPEVLPYMIERPQDYLPDTVPAHDVLIAIRIHEQILLECLKRAPKWGTRGVVVPIEVGDWLSGSAMTEAQEICEHNGIEAAFPKPFCMLNPPKDSLLAEFRETFHIGYPEVELTVKDERIARANVRVSAPCGSTYFVARWLVGRRVDDDLKYDVVARKLHSFPCTASMAWDEALGDTIMHESGQAHYKILAPLGLDQSRMSRTIVTPMGRTLPRPVPVAENVKNIESAKCAVLTELTPDMSMDLPTLRKRVRHTAAALNSALLLLRQQGDIVVDKGVIRKTGQPGG